jgi:hypothetical protein
MVLAEIHTFLITPVVSKLFISQPLIKEHFTIIWDNIPKSTTHQKEVAPTQPLSKRKMTYSRNHKTIGTMDSQEKWDWWVTIKKCWTKDFPDQNQSKKFKVDILKKCIKTLSMMSKRNINLPSRLSIADRNKVKGQTMMIISDSNLIHLMTELFHI